MVYEALKNTALHCEDGVRNARIYLYVVYFTMFSFAFNYHWLFLVSFIVLIAFQAMINSDRIAIERVSAYIRVFFEMNRNDIHWSLLNKDPEHVTTYGAQYKNIGWFIHQYSSSILAILSLFSFGVTIVQGCDGEVNNIPLDAWIEYPICLMLTILVIHINKSVYVNGIEYPDTTLAIEKSIKKFYSKHYPSEEIVQESCREKEGK